MSTWRMHDIALHGGLRHGAPECIDRPHRHREAVCGIQSPQRLHTCGGRLLLPLLLRGRLNGGRISRSGARDQEQRRHQRRPRWASQIYAERIAPVTWNDTHHDTAGLGHPDP